VNRTLHVTELPLQYFDLVAQYEDLDVFVSVALGEQANRAKVLVRPR
jgi:hypothetical protein